MKVLSEKEIKKLLKEKYNSKDFKFDTKTNQNFIELINANFESNTGYIVYINRVIYATRVRTGYY